MKKLLALMVLCGSLVGCGTTTSQQRMRHILINTASNDYGCKGVVYSSRYLITAKHCTSGKSHHGTFYYSRSYLGKGIRTPVLWRSDTHDLSILRINSPKNTPLKLAVNPTKGMNVFMWDGKKFLKGPLVAVNKTIYGYKKVHLARFKVIKGMSGSGVFNDMGELVGIVSHSWPTKTHPRPYRYTVIQPAHEIVKGLKAIKKKHASVAQW